MLRKLSLILAVIVAVLFFLQYFAGLPLKTYLKSRIAAETRADVDIGSADVSVFTLSVKLKDLSIKTFEGVRPQVVCRIQSLSVGFDPIVCLRGIIGLRSIRIKEAYLGLTRIIRDEEAKALKELGAIISPQKALISLLTLFETDKENISGAAYANSPEREADMPEIPPLRIDLLKIENSRIEVIDYFPKNEIVRTTLDDYRLIITDFDATVPKEDITLNFEFTSDILAVEKGRIEAKGETKPFKDKLDLKAGVTVNNIYIPHFRNYFALEKYEIKDGIFDLKSNIHCFNNYLKSSNTLFLKNIQIMKTEGIQPEDEGSNDIKLFEVPVRFLISYLNGIGEKGLEIRFPLEGNIVERDFKTGKMLREVLWHALTKRVVGTMPVSQNSIAGFFSSLVKGAEKRDVTTQR